MSIFQVFKSHKAEVNLLLECFYSKPLPKKSSESSGLSCILRKGRLFFYVRPRDDRLNDEHLFTLICCLSASTIIELVESILSSKRILIFSRCLSKLSHCCCAVLSLIRPFVWPFPFASVMPSDWVVDLMDSPCSFLYGCLSENKEFLSKISDSDFVFVDLDSDSINAQLLAEQKFPSDLRRVLFDSLNYLTRFRLKKSDSTLLNVAVSEAFLQIFAELFGRLTEFIDREDFSICSDYFQGETKVCPNRTKKIFSYRYFLLCQSLFDI